MQGGDEFQSNRFHAPEGDATPVADEDLHATDVAGLERAEMAWRQVRAGERARRGRGRRWACCVLLQGRSLQRVQWPPVCPGRAFRVARPMNPGGFRCGTAHGDRAIIEQQEELQPSGVDGRSHRR
ncbi:hypothetical protein Mpe_A1611 [Methylibium petroleiphilum PM1]|uniref:Uncharacterized protein n=1 Tax=Methylibium petroleiphilum (strain ATCC BAA-1232 / LMG 22953 / PM1) TaxID=420662 RepID=A2SG84_METPP|nr:hypothetical protein Mpe_A1611 [Methylibium petroleiphilum PM1]